MTESNNNNNNKIRCYYEILGIDRDADIATIKKAHRKLALQLHPDKNVGNEDNAHAKFLEVQQAYETLSDEKERHWYDEHRDAILKGWTSSSDQKQPDDMVFNIVPYMFAGCYSGYDDEYEKSFYHVYNTVFRKIAHDEPNDNAQIYININFGDSTTEWKQVAKFYQIWESYSTTISFAWVDPWDVNNDADNRRVRRIMDDENKKSRKQARRIRNEDILALVHFVKRRDPRVKEHQKQIEKEKILRKEQMEKEAQLRKKEKEQAMEQWRQQAEEEQAAYEEEDRIAGRIRLADLEDDYDYGGKKGKKGKKKGKKKKKQVESSDEESESQKNNESITNNDNTVEDSENLDGDDTKSDEIDSNVLDKKSENLGDTLDDIEKVIVVDEIQQQTVREEDADSASAESSEEEEEIIDSWRCECCKKDFKSEGQMENHLKSKKHKVAWKKYEAKIAQKMEHDIMNETLNELED